MLWYPHANHHAVYTEVPAYGAPGSPMSEKCQWAVHLQLTWHTPDICFRAGVRGKYTSRLITVHCATSVKLLVYNLVLVSHHRHREVRICEVGFSLNII